MIFDDFDLIRLAVQDALWWHFDIGYATGDGVNDAPVDPQVRHRINTLIVAGALFLQGQIGPFGVAQVCASDDAAALFPQF